MESSGCATRDPPPCPAKRDLSKLEKQNMKTHLSQARNKLSQPHIFHSLPHQPLTCAGRKKKTRAVWTDLQPDLPHKMTHLTLTGRDCPQLTFSPTTFMREKSRLKVKHKPTHCFLGPLVFFSIYVADAGWRDEK